jgi:uncharacterized protein (DUF302 family)/uncharacterized membrane protein YidH (DUF202 family)
VAGEPIARRAASGPSDYLAAERTFLAWIRTGLALMGFGFVVARFGLFLRAMQVGEPDLQPRAYGLSVWFGTVLIVLGVVVNLTSAWSHVRLVRELKRRGSAFEEPSTLAIVVAVLLAMLGLAMAIYLMSVPERAQTHVGTLQEERVTQQSEKGIVTIPTNQSVEQTVRKLEEVLRANGTKRFALVDHSGEAQQVGMHMRPTKLLIFGNPKAGTPLMVATPSIAIDLPLKVLVWEDANGKVWISYNAPAYLAARHGVPAELSQNIEVLEGIARSAAE